MRRYDYFKGNDGKWYIRWTEHGVSGVCFIHFPKDEEDAKRWCEILNK